MRAEDYFVAEDIAAAESLPASAFTGRDFLARELETLFPSSWQLLPEPGELGAGGGRLLSERLKVRGTHVPVSLLGRPLFLSRDWKAKLHLFPNVCTHAWYPVVEGAGRGKTLVCGQHGRSFDCAGRFLAQAGFGPGELPGFPRDCDHLADLGVGQWNQFLFGSIGRPAGTLAALLAPMQASVKKLTVARFKRQPRGEVTREVDGNWKQHACNYMDRFHISFIHRPPHGLADGVDLASYKTELYGDSALQWVYARDPEHGFDPKHLPTRFSDPKAPEKRVFALWWFLFPNMTFNFYPWGLSINVYAPVPGAPDKTSFTWEHFVGDAAKYRRRNEVWLDQQVDDEDVAAMSLVRRGAASGLAPRGRFAPREETGPHWLHRRIHQAVFADAPAA